MIVMALIITPDMHSLCHKNLLPVQIFTRPIFLFIKLCDICNVAFRYKYFWSKIEALKQAVHDCAIFSTNGG